MLQGPSKRRKLEHKQRSLTSTITSADLLRRIACFLDVFGHGRIVGVDTALNKAVYKQPGAWPCDFHLGESKGFMQAVIANDWGCKSIATAYFNSLNDQNSAMYLARKYKSSLVNLSMIRFEANVIFSRLRTLDVAVCIDGHDIDSFRRGLFMCPELANLDAIFNWTCLLDRESKLDRSFPSSITSVNIQIIGEVEIVGGDASDLVLFPMPGLTKMKLTVRKGEFARAHCLINTANFPRLTDLDILDTAVDADVHFIDEGIAKQLIKFKFRAGGTGGRQLFWEFVVNGADDFEALEYFESNVIPSRSIRMPRLQTAYIKTLVRHPEKIKLRDGLDYALAGNDGKLPVPLPSRPTLFVPLELCPLCALGEGMKCTCPKCHICRERTIRCDCDV